MFRVRLLGPFEVERDGRRVRMPTGQLRVLLAVLAMRPGMPVPVDEIADRLWGPDSPSSARTTLRGHVKRLRRVLDGGGSPIHSSRGGYLLDLSPEDIDVHHFRRLLAHTDCTRGSPAESTTLDLALSLWRGAAFSGVNCDALHREIVPALQEQRLRALHRRIELGMHRGEYDWILPRLREIVVEEPLREIFWAQLLCALAQSGSQAEALATYQECRETLADNLGVEPSAPLRELHQRMLTGRPKPIPAQQDHWPAPALFS